MTITVFIAHFNNQHSRFLVYAVNINEAQKKEKRIENWKLMIMKCNNCIYCLSVTLTEVAMVHKWRCTTANSQRSDQNFLTTIGPQTLQPAKVCR